MFFVVKVKDTESIRFYRAFGTLLNFGTDRKFF